MRRILLTSALPYANGSIHLGHLVEYIQTDIWSRFQKMQGHEVYYICADDTHGTPVMLRAEKEGMAPTELIRIIHEEHSNDFVKFLIDFDFFGSTNNNQTQQIANDIYRKLKEKTNLIVEKTIEQFFDPEKLMYLPDRYVKGTCPKCEAKDQYGDSCEKCGATYSSTDLLEPTSSLTGLKPTRKKTSHYFFRLSDPQCSVFLRDWVEKDGRLQSEARNKVREWFEAGFIDWDITRDAPYFGFEIPDAPDKFFYVWLDAPIGYFGSFKEFCENQDIDFESFVSEPEATNKKTELIHFIGKDILYFHALFFPAILRFSGYRTPSAIYAHGFLTVNGQKMSKSRGTFITAAQYVSAGLDPEWLRYYYFAKLNSSLQDIDLNVDDFRQKVNSDLVGKYINIASRSSKFINKYFKNVLADSISHTLLETMKSQESIISNQYENREYSKALKNIMYLADSVNQFIDREKPWKLAGVDNKRLHEICTIALEAFRLLTLYLKPVLPSTAKRVEEFLRIPEMSWNDVNYKMESQHEINKYHHLIKRVTEADMDKISPID